MWWQWALAYFEVGCKLIAFLSFFPVAAYLLGHAAGKWLCR